MQRLPPLFFSFRETKSDDRISRIHRAASRRRAGVSSSRTMFNGIIHARTRTNIYADWLPDCFSRDERVRSKKCSEQESDQGGSENRTTPLHLIEHSRNFFSSPAFFPLSPAFYRCIFVLLPLGHASRLFRVWITSRSVYSSMGLGGFQITRDDEKLSTPEKTCWNFS